ncbi:FkbM family methyltransferase [Methanobrevibacter sp.]|uniref:FkbM family methyltransferase n=1 Tax=Methanobrevibacter sp. TaxID=66852 RepID=UPI0025FC3303|nr:FkbM family methyltransferase [Methanobrevibacter sp.]MBQ6511874.1 FkbM family methyltransferase [Methanobrevibacter sp.]
MFKKISYLIDYFKYLDNPIEALKFKFGLTKSCNIITKNSKKEITIHNEFTLNRLMRKIKYLSPDKTTEFLEYMEEIDEDSEYVVIGDIKYVNIFNSRFKEKSSFEYEICNEEYFSSDEWDMINFEGRHVIDIGGNIGDTSLYFAKRGANVIGFEPVKHLFDLALENIALNEDIKEKIIYVNKGVGAKRGTLKIDANSIKSYIGNDTYDMEIITIEDIFNNYEFTPDILKMDCEGCEFEIILNENLTMFNDIVFEHHSKIANKDYKPLITKLKEEGFVIDTYPVAASGLNFEDIGIIHAYK